MHTQIYFARTHSLTDPLLTLIHGRNRAHRVHRRARHRLAHLSHAGHRGLQAALLPRYFRCQPLRAAVLMLFYCPGSGYMADLGRQDDHRVRCCRPACATVSGLTAAAMVLVALAVVERCHVSCFEIFSPKQVSLCTRHPLQPPQRRERRSRSPRSFVRYGLIHGGRQGGRALL